MAQVKVNYLMIGKNYSDGQSLTSKDEAMMPDSLIQHYLERAELRGLDFDVETEIIEVPEEDVEDYVFYGYQIL